MSLTHVIPNETLQVLGRIYELNLLEPIPNDCLKGTTFGLDLLLPRTDGRDQKVCAVPRISISYLEHLREKLSNGFHGKTCENVSLLYRAGLGLPKDARLSAYWKAYSNMSQPVHDDVVISEDDLLHVLDAHIAKAKNESFDKIYAYQIDVHNHLNKLKRYCVQYSYGEKFSDVTEAFTENNTKDFVVQDNLKGYNSFVVFKNTVQGFKLYAAFAEHDGKLVPFIRQMLSSDIVTSIPKENFKSVSTYLVLSGKFNFAKSVNELVVKTATVDDVWNEFAGYDLVSHSDFKPDYSSDVSKSITFTREYKSRYRNAKEFVAKHEGNKRAKEKLVKAKKLIDVYDKHRKILRTTKVTDASWRKLNPANHLRFAVQDVFFADSDQRLVDLPIKFEKVMNHLKKCGFNIAKFEVHTLKRSTRLSGISKFKSVRIRSTDRYKNLNIYDLWFGANDGKL